PLGMARNASLVFSGGRRPLERCGLTSAPMAFVLSAESFPFPFNLSRDEAAFVPSRTDALLSFGRCGGERRARTFLFEFRAKIIRLRIPTFSRSARSTINGQCSRTNCQP